MSTGNPYAPRSPSPKNNQRFSFTLQGREPSCPSFFVVFLVVGVPSRPRPSRKSLIPKCRPLATSSQSEYPRTQWYKKAPAPTTSPSNKRSGTNVRLQSILRDTPAHNRISIACAQPPPSNRLQTRHRETPTAPPNPYVFPPP